MGSRGLVTALRGLGGTERRGMETPATVIGKQRTSRRSESDLGGAPAEALLRAQASRASNRPSNRYRPLGARVDGLLALFATGRA